MQKSRNHMAVLIDEYGGFSGIVTIEDLVEEIVGDINEEYDTVVPDIQQTGENTYRLDGGMLIEDINEQLDLDLKTENYDTLSGYLIEKLGYIPSGNQESVVCEYGKFIVEQMEGRRIRTVMLEMAD